MGTELGGGGGFKRKEEMWRYGPGLLPAAASMPQPAAAYQQPAAAAATPREFRCRPRRGGIRSTSDLSFQVPAATAWAGPLASVVDADLQKTNEQALMLEELEEKAKNRKSWEDEEAPPPVLNSDPHRIRVGLEYIPQTEPLAFAMELDIGALTTFSMQQDFTALGENHDAAAGVRRSLLLEKEVPRNQISSWQVTDVSSFRPIPVGQRRFLTLTYEVPAGAM